MDPRLRNDLSTRAQSAVDRHPLSNGMTCRLRTFTRNAFRSVRCKAGDRDRTLYGPARGTIRLKGTSPAANSRAKFKSRCRSDGAARRAGAAVGCARIDNFMTQDYLGVQLGTMRPELREAITQLSMEFRLLTQFTSFVAVEEMVVNDGETLRRIDVPVEVPEGVNQNFLVSGALAGAGGGPTGLFTVYSIRV